MTSGYDYFKTTKEHGGMYSNHCCIYPNPTYSKSQLMLINSRISALDLILGEQSGYLLLASFGYGSRSRAC